MAEPEQLPDVSTTDSVNTMIREIGRNHESPVAKILSAVMDELGGMEFLTDWATENPTAFINLWLAALPQPSQHAQPKGKGLHLHVHPSLAPGPLDVVDEQ